MTLLYRRFATIFGLLVLCFAWASPSLTLAGSDLTLAPDLSFTDDSSFNFPIAGKNLTEGKPAAGRVTMLFFGTAHCWNTNREAERLVKVYPEYRGKVDFVVVDLNNVSNEQRELVAKYYKGAIPTIAVLDSRGEVIYDRAGETASQRGDTSKLQSLIDSAR